MGRGDPQATIFCLNVNDKRVGWIQNSLCIPDRKNLYGRDRKNSGIKRVPVYESLLSYKLSLFSFAEPSGIRREMYVFRYNQVRYKQRILYCVSFE